MEGLLFFPLGQRALRRSFSSRKARTFSYRKARSSACAFRAFFL